jgi:hypothetical protein
MALGLGASLGKTGVVTPGILTDGLVMKHMYPAGTVQPLSDGAAYFLRSNTDYVEILDDASINIGAGDLTWSAWIWVNDVSAADHGIIGKHQDETHRYYLRVKSDGSLNFYGKADGNSSAHTNGTTSSGHIVDKTWTHVVAVLDSSERINLYKNSVLIGTSTSGVHGENKDNTGVLTIGSRGQSTGTLDAFDGYICNVGMWKRMLTQEEIKSIMFKQYADLTTSEKTSLVSFWNLDEAYESSSFVLDSHHSGGNTLGSNLITYNPGFESGSSSLTGNADTGWKNNNVDGDDVSEVNTNSLYVKTGSNSWHIQEVGGASPTGIMQNCTITANTVIKVTAEVYVVSGKATIDCRKGSDGSVNFVSPVENTTTGQWETLTQIFDSGSETSLSARLVTKDSLESEFYVDNISVQQINGNTGTLS